MRPILLTAALLGLSLPLSAQASKRHLKEAGRDGKDAVQAVTRSAKAGAGKAAEAGKEIGQGAKEAGTTLGHAFRDAAKKLKDKVDE